MGKDAEGSGKAYLEDIFWHLSREIVGYHEKTNQKIFGLMDQTLKQGLSNIMQRSNLATT
jgi:hypothetical protein